MNGDLIGETLDLREFLFGAARNSVGVIMPVLRDLQDGKCFYCRQPVRVDAGHVDHFIPWAKYPIDLGHNFVLADNVCNGKKRDRMPHVDHLGRWVERNRTHGLVITTAVQDQITCDYGITNRVAYWAYEQVEHAGGLTWLRADHLHALAANWRDYLFRPASP